MPGRVHWEPLESIWWSFWLGAQKVEELRGFGRS